MGVIWWQRLEGAGVFLGLSLVYAMVFAGVYPWYAIILIFFAPDVSFVAYGLGAKFGGQIYNAVHLYATGLIISLLGWVVHSDAVLAFGVLWVAHAGFDRMFGYGLKASSGFKDTHLGRLDKKA